MTPPGFKFSSTINMQNQYPSSSSSTPRGRHPRQPQIDDSPLSLPALLSDDEELSPGGSTGILTPPSINVIEPSISHAISEHDMLRAFAHETTPTFSQDAFDRRASYPLLSPQRPMVQKQMWPHISRKSSPPTTPKGHPLTRGKSYFNFKVSSHLTPYLMCSQLT